MIFKQRTSHDDQSDLVDRGPFAMLALFFETADSLVADVGALCGVDDTATVWGDIFETQAHAGGVDVRDEAFCVCELEVNADAGMAISGADGGKSVWVEDVLVALLDGADGVGAADTGCNVSPVDGVEVGHVTSVTTETGFCGREDGV